MLKMLNRVGNIADFAVSVCLRFFTGAVVVFAFLVLWILFMILYHSIGIFLIIVSILFLVYCLGHIILATIAGDL